MNTAISKNLQSLILQWFRKNRRDLPWRKTKDPYKIWVSEIMLQQTQVNTVIPYYERWMKNFPTLETLSGAPLSRVLKQWEGLGYYSRARNLHKAAKFILKKFGGRLPDSRKELEELPGIGRYTAGAIASIAFNRAEPILDGNVKRLLARVFAVKKPVDKAAGEKKLWEIARTLVEAGTPPRHCEPAEGGRSNLRVRGLLRRPAASGGTPRNDGTVGDLNQGLMELGALVCLPENPQCEICPLEKLCEAHRLGKEIRFPVKSRKERTEKLRTLAAVLWKNGRVLLERQPLGSRWGGLWMFPQWIHKNGRRETEFLTEKINREFGMKAKSFKERGEIEHGFTKYRVRLRVYEGTVAPLHVIARSPALFAGRRSNPQTEIASAASGGLAMTRWVSPKNLRRLPLPRPHQRIAELLPSHA